MASVREVREGSIVETTYFALRRENADGVFSGLGLTLRVVHANAGRQREHAGEAEARNVSVR